MFLYDHHKRLVHRLDLDVGSRCLAALAAAVANDWHAPYYSLGHSAKLITTGDCIDDHAMEACRG
jgi:hypothetical protein